MSCGWSWTRVLERQGQRRLPVSWALVGEARMPGVAARPSSVTGSRRSAGSREELAGCRRAFGRVTSGAGQMPEDAPPYPCRRHADVLARFQFCFSGSSWQSSPIYRAKNVQQPIGGSQMIKGTHEHTGKTELTGQQQYGKIFKFFVLWELDFSNWLVRNQLCPKTATRGILNSLLRIC
jgi:hypothetical protein